MVVLDIVEVVMVIKHLLNNRLTVTSNFSQLTSQHKLGPTRIPISKLTDVMRMPRGLS